MVVVAPIQRERRVAHAVGVATIEVCAVSNASEVRDGRDERGLLRTAEHEVWERNLHGSRVTVEVGDARGALGAFLGIGRGEAFGLDGAATLDNGIFSFKAVAHLLHI